MYEIRKINIIDAGKYSAIISGIVALIPSLSYVVMFLFAWRWGSYYSGFAWMAIFAFFLLPLIAGGVGFVFGLAYAALYNVLASHIGGIRLDIVLREEGNKFDGE